MYRILVLVIAVFSIQVARIGSFGLVRTLVNPCRPLLTSEHDLLLKRRWTAHFASSTDSDVEWNPSSAPKLDFDECYYSVLEVDPRGDLQVIKKAYYKLVLKYHPDNKESDVDKALGNKQMMVINNAYKILKDPATRQEYDLKRAKGLLGGRAGVKGAGQNHPRYARKPPQAPSTQPPRSPSYSSTTRTSSSVKSPHSVRTPQSDRTWEWSDSGSSSSSGRKEGLWEGTDIPKVFSRGDGSVFSLYAYLQSLKQQRLVLVGEMAKVQRDWGEVKDLDMIEQRLKQNEQLRKLDRTIFELEEEILEIADRMDAEKKRRERAVWDRDGDGGYGRYDSLYDSDDDSYARRQRSPYDRYTSYPQPETQPQRQKTNPYPPKKVRLDDDEGVRWRDFYERRRRGEEFSGFGGEGSDRNGGGRRRGSDEMDLDDLLDSRDYFRNIADKYENYASSSQDKEDWREKEVSWDEELRQSFWKFVNTPLDQDDDVDDEDD